MSSGRIAQHRNYADVMARHERDIKLKRITRVFIYFLIIVFLLIVFLIVRRWEIKKDTGKPASTLVVEKLKKGLAINR